MYIWYDEHGDIIVVQYLWSHRLVYSFLQDNAFKFDEKSGGLCSEADYPYKARVGPACLTNCTDVPGSIVKTFVDVPPGDLRSLLSAVAMQPISVAIQAGNFAFQFYKSGV
jgi:hypothetical protein